MANKHMGFITFYFPPSASLQCDVDEKVDRRVEHDESVADVLDESEPPRPVVDVAHEQVIGRRNQLPDVAEEEEPDYAQRDAGEAVLPPAAHGAVGAAHAVAVDAGGPGGAVLARERADATASCGTYIGGCRQRRRAPPLPVRGCDRDRVDAVDGGDGHGQGDGGRVEGCGAARGPGDGGRGPQESDAFLAVLLLVRRG